MSINEVINQLKSYQGPAELTLHAGADETSINEVEFTYNIKLPDDFKTFYRFTDGFETVEDIFNMIPFVEIVDIKKPNNNTLYFAEYMIYSDVWQLDINPENYNDYKIIYNDPYNKLVLTTSLAEFISRFLEGGVFDKRGLYEWHDEIEAQSIYSTDPKSVKQLLTVYYRCLIFGIISRKAVIEWADNIIASEDNPDYFFIELSLSHDLNSLLSVILARSAPDSNTTVRAIFGLLYHQLLAHLIKGEKAVEIIDQYYFKGALLPDEINQIYELTIDKVIGNKPDENLTQHLLHFLVNYQEFDLTNYKYWDSISYRVEHGLTNEQKKSAVRKQPALKSFINKLKIDFKLLRIISLFAVFAFVIITSIHNEHRGLSILGTLTYDLYLIAVIHLVLFGCYYLLKGVDWLIRILFIKPR